MKKFLCLALTMSLMLLAGPVLAIELSLNSAAESGDLKKVEAALASGVDINQTYYNLEEGYDFVSPPIVLAAYNKHYAVVEYLLKKGADPNAAMFHWTALHAAVDKGDLKTAALLLKFKANPNIGLEADSMGKAFYSESGQTPLHRAAQSGQLELVRLLLANGADPHLEADYGYGYGDVLVFAILAEQPSKPVIELLLSKGFPQAGSGRYLAAAAMAGRLELMRLLQQRGAKVNSFGDQGALMIENAIVQGQKQAIDWLLQQALNPYLRNRAGQTADMLLAESSLGAADITRFGQKLTQLRKQRLDAARLALKAPAQLNTRDESGWTPLFVAVAAGDQALSAQLLAKGARSDLSDANGYTPLLLALQYAPALVETLLAKGADLTTQSPYGTPLINAVERGDLVQVRLLLAKGADPNLEQRFEAINLTGETYCTSCPNPKSCWVSLNDTPLTVAIDNQDADMLKLLLEGGADPRLPNSQGMNALEKAQASQPALLKLLEAQP